MRNVCELITSTKTVLGIIVDQDGQPIPGVNIIDGNDQTNGTVTDFEEAEWCSI